ncbi:MAG: aminoglycoside phosphotransferase family protein, partial [Candidatus Helarchaeota archaeon]|nr:aminoglycoside phosphotransferase family protein [Candidatus Helarchaeota archaeon]
MKEKPDLQDKQIIDRIREVFSLHIARVEFLPIGDISSAKYRVVSNDQAAYFLKLRKKGFKEISVTIPYFLHEQGIRQVIAPIKTIDGELWTSLDDYTCILYPFIEGRNGFQAPLSDDQWVELGAALKRVHSVQLPRELKSQIPCETWSPDWRGSALDFLIRAENNSYEDPVSRKMAAILREHRDDIRRIIERAETLCKASQPQPAEWVLCHTDLHAGNLLLEASGSMHMIDWDDP